MKNNVLFCLIIIILSVSLLIGCGFNTYAAEIIENVNTYHYDTLSDFVIPNTLKICGAEFSVSYNSYYVSELTGEIIVVLNANGTENGKIEINENSDIVGVSMLGTIIGFSDLKEKNEQSVKTIVEEALSSIYDFSRYNYFIYSEAAMGGYYLRWYVKDKVLCNQTAELLLDAEGNIQSFGITNAKPDGEVKEYITDSERDSLIKSTVEKRHNVEISKINIKTELYSLYKSKNAMIYGVESVDNGGFSYYDMIVITK